MYCVVVIHQLFEYSIHPIDDALDLMVSGFVVLYLGNGIPIFRSGTLTAFGFIHLVNIKLEFNGLKSS